MESEGGGGWRKARRGGKGKLGIDGRRVREEGGRQGKRKGEEKEREDREEGGRRGRKWRRKRRCEGRTGREMEKEGGDRWETDREGQENIRRSSVRREEKGGGGPRFVTLGHRQSRGHPEGP